MLDSVADRVRACRRRRVLVGVDGRSGSGKSTLADELANVLAAAGVVVVRSTTDAFHQPRAVRLARGATSARGYYEDSHPLDRIESELLSPFAAGQGSVRTAAFDEPSDEPREVTEVVADAAVLVFDGLFLHRDELVDHWDVSVYLDADTRRDAEWLAFLFGGLPPDPVEQAAAIDERLTRARWPRYRRGWERYVTAVDPAARATFVIDNNDFARPRLIAAR